MDGPVVPNLNRIGILVALNLKRRKTVSNAMLPYRVLHHNVRPILVPDRTELVPVPTIDRDITRVGERDREPDACREDTHTNIMIEPELHSLDHWLDRFPKSVPSSPFMELEESAVEVYPDPAALAREPKHPLW